MNKKNLIDDMVNRFGKNNVIGYLCCSIYECIQEANYHYELNQEDKQNECYEKMLYLIDEFERITGETAPREDIFEELSWHSR